MKLPLWGCAHARRGPGPLDWTCLKGHDPHALTGVSQAHESWFLRLPCRSMPRTPCPDRQQIEGQPWRKTS